MATTAPYGTWTSPVSPELVVEGARTISELLVDGETLCWLELRPDEGGRSAVVRRRADGSTDEVTPPTANVRTRVHEYGGGAYLVAEGIAWYCDFDDQRVYRLDPGSEPRPITPDPGQPSSVRYADFVRTPDGGRLICIRETHHGPRATDVVNEVVALPADGEGPIEVVASGRDFYSTPRLSPDGTQLAYVAWDHPNMPWDSTEVVLADLDGATVRGSRTVAGGPGTAESVILPSFSPEGVLHVVTDRTGWWNLHRLEGDELHNLAEVPLDLGQPGWQLGASLYGFLSNGTVAVVATDNGIDRPSLLDPESGTVVALTDHTACRGLVVADDAVWFAGASPTTFQEVVCVAPLDGDVEVVHRTRELPVDATWLPQPEQISFPTGDDETAHGFWYPPTSPDHDGPDGELPPLIVTSHGGPTSHSPPLASLATAYWTSRGFGVVDVNYRGSTGFGRTYRNALRDRWGIADVQDCEAAAAHLAASGQADGSRLLIRGGSASGYTTLCALAFTDTFAAGASYYGVADPALLAAETHKFESRYLDGLLGPYPEAGDVYEARSPLHHADRISCPIILFQGLEDRVVPPEQSEAMAAALAARGVPHAYIGFAGEQHGFRDAQNLIRCLSAELSFYTQVLGVPHPDGVEPVSLRSGSAEPDGS